MTRDTQRSASVDPFEVDPRMTKKQVRREFVKSLAAAATATLAMGAPRHCGQNRTRKKSRLPQMPAFCCGWPAGWLHGDTFDPKHYEPFRVGLPVSSMLSTFPAIPTAVDGLQICEGLENIASVMDRATLIRSAVQPTSEAFCIPATSITGIPDMSRLRPLPAPILGHGWLKFWDLAIR